MKERLQEELDEVLVRDVELDEPFFLTKKEAEIQEQLGRVTIVKDEPIDYSKRIT